MRKIASTKIEELQAYLSSLSIERPGVDTLHEGGSDEIKKVVPARGGIYAIFDSDTGKCFYVGSSVNSMRSRLLTHYRKDAKNNYRGNSADFEHQRISAFGFTK